jgi:hypothetical protein
LGECEVRLTGVGAKAQRSLNGRVGEGEALWCMIESQEVELVVRAGKLVIRTQECIVARYRIFKQARCLKQVFFCPCTETNPVNETFSAYVKIISGEVSCRVLLNGGFL